jgi:ACR3 family arsenite efflux pump ArsB
LGIGAGVLLGQCFRRVERSPRGSLVNLVVAVLLWVMIYPMMIRSTGAR